MKKSLGIFTALVGAALVTVVACSTSSGGSSFSCTSKGPCPNDQPPTSAEVSQCQSLQSDPKCGSLFTAVANCAVSNGGSTCDSAGKSSGSLPSQCKSQESSYENCVLAELDAGGISFDSGTGGGGFDSGSSSGGPTTANCVALEACCTKLSGTQQTACQQAANFNNDQGCQDLLSTFQADGGACAK